MASKLVIVESPAKAKTIGGYLGSDYEVLASVGHIRDLPLNGRSLPDEIKKKWWADYAVDVENGFEPIYEVPSEKSAQVTKLRKALKGKDALVLATDEDREGESISWHLLEVLNPPKSVKVQRVTFHEITKEAIQEAFKHPRQIDTKLVEAQETRRILDRLYGYTLSPVLWTRVSKNLSAGRVQSPAVKLIVDREEERRKFISASYWDLKALVKVKAGEFEVTLRQVGDNKVASGKDFDDESGRLKDSKKPPLVLNQQQAAELAEQAFGAKPWKVSSLEENEGVERPAAPFMTTSLQQEANRKFGFSADRTMRIAQGLYEGINIGGEQVGLITYMRTDSLTLSGDALGKLRNLIGKEYPDCLPDKPNVYSSKVRNAQEAHEAIRPTDPARKPSNLTKYLDQDQLKIYDLIWKRTVASQMKHARVLRTEVEVTASGVKFAGQTQELVFNASGKRILFDGFRRVYLEGSDDPDADLQTMERRLPEIVLGESANPGTINPTGHETKPPARFTDASLIKKLEEQGIGRPSTYASIISTIVDRGYVRKQGKQLVPTWKAYLSMQVLEQNFNEFMALSFTARMDDVLDDIAEGKVESREYLAEFFLGQGDQIGLKQAVDERKKDIPFPAFIVGNYPESEIPILLRTGKDGSPFLQVELDGAKQYANVPDDLAPAELTPEKAVELLQNKAAPSEAVGYDPVTCRRLLVKFRQGYYLETERTEEEIEAKQKPRWVSVPNGVDPRTLEQDELNFLCELPRNVGANPETGEVIEFKIGKFGAYVECGSERRTVEDWRLGRTMDADVAMEILAQPKFGGRRTARAAASALAEFGELEGAAGPVKVLAGRFGPYVTDGETNATLPKGIDPVSLSAEQAKELLDAKRAAGPSTGRKGKRRVNKKAAAKSKSTGAKKTARGKK